MNTDIRTHTSFTIYYATNVCIMYLGHTH